MPNIPPNPDGLAASNEAVRDLLNKPGRVTDDMIARAAVSAYLAVALPEVTSVDYLATPEGHYDAWGDTHDGYTQRKGWTLTCIWCRAEFIGDTKREALKGYQAHEESILQKLRKADAERAKSSPEVKQ